MTVQTETKLGSTGLIWAIGAVIAFAAVFVVWPAMLATVPLAITAIVVSYREMKRGVVDRRSAVAGYTVGIVVLVLSLLVFAAVTLAILNTG